MVASPSNLLFWQLDPPEITLTARSTSLRTLTARITSLRPTTLSREMVVTMTMIRQLSGHPVSVTRLCRGAVAWQHCRGMELIGMCREVGM